MSVSRRPATPRDIMALSAPHVPDGLGRAARRAARAALTVLAFASWSASPPAAVAQSGFNSSFDHFTTGFRLDGAHRTADCESCHAGGVFQGTPTECVDCHSLGGRIGAAAKPVYHVLSTDFCEDCHRTAAWFPLAEMNHDSVFGTCSTCHDNVQSAGKPPDHPPTQLDCAACHAATAWIPARFDHADVTGGCAGCHDGVQAAGKHAGHLQTTAECNLCHLTVAWLPATFDHDTVAPGTCAGCHDGTTATGKDPGHFTTRLECDDCHGPAAWSPVTFAHLSAAYPGDHREPLGCTDCHTTNAEAVAWPFAAYAPDCAGCHAGDFEAGPHEGATVSELRDCAGTCHESSPEHSLNSREW